MTQEVERLSDAILYEGYLLYPYRRSALKNRYRTPFGTLYPEPYCRLQRTGDPDSLQLQCVATAEADARIAVRLRFLQMLESEGVVRDVPLGECALGMLEEEGVTISFGSAPVQGELSVRASLARAGVYVVTVRVANRSVYGETGGRDQDEALLHAVASPHLIVTIAGGALTSVIDPPESLRDVVATCRSVGTWPVLLGAPGSSRALLSAPIILYDYPEIAPESPGDFFDGTEVDELLTLRVLTLTAEEKDAMAQSDSRAKALLERTESAGLEGLRALHGAFRAPEQLRPGMSVRLRPSGRADIIDLALDGKRATVVGVERDFEGRTYVAVTVDDDPGSDMGVHGHRFFLRPDEVELLATVRA